MRTRLLTRRAVGLHATLLAVLAACLGLGWWQLSRALGGNSLSWVYTFEWPFFAAYGVYVWWRLLHEDGEETGPLARRSSELPALERVTEPELVDALGYDPYDEHDPDLAAYNRYLASLHEADQERQRRPRPRQAGSAS
ncbi:MAG: hypothetical protein ACYCSF_03150 [Acidimicrobiales bacterium]